jgi:ATP-binding cassette subfamily B (MDR/TAP) protein 1
LEKFYEADSGRVLIDGVDIKTISPTLLHRHVGLVSQEPTLFAMSIRDNIRYAVDTINFNVRKEALDGIIQAGDVDSLLVPINEEIMIEAAKKANAHNFIMNLPDGYDTIIGERGVSLSGGQKQRIAIARAVLQDPKILLLDEATSALDSKSETIVQNALDKLMQGRTTIIIAHNLSTIHNCDRIIVMSQGKIVESGNHVDLCVMNGTYAKMATRKQSFRSSKRITLNNESLDLSSGTEPAVEEEHRTLVERETSSFSLFRFFKMIGFEWIVLTPVSVIITIVYM